MSILAFQPSKGEWSLGLKGRDLVNESFDKEYWRKGKTSLSLGNDMSNVSLPLIGEQGTKLCFASAC